MKGSGCCLFSPSWKMRAKALSVGSASPTQVWRDPQDQDKVRQISCSLFLENVMNRVAWKVAVGGSLLLLVLFLSQNIYYSPWIDDYNPQIWVVALMAGPNTEGKPVSIADLSWHRACPQPLFAALSTLPLQVADETPTACWHSIKGSS